MTLHTQWWCLSEYPIYIFSAALYSYILKVVVSTCMNTARDLLVYPPMLLMQSSLLNMNLRQLTLQLVSRSVVGTFLCGPAILGKVLEKKCAKFSDVDPRKTRFYFNKENFWVKKQQRTLAFWRLTDTFTEDICEKVIDYAAWKPAALTGCVSALLVWLHVDHKAGHVVLHYSGTEFSAMSNSLLITMTQGLNVSYTH